MLVKINCNKVLNHVFVYLIQCYLLYFIQELSILNAYPALYFLLSFHPHSLYITFSPFFISFSCRFPCDISKRIISA